jgi:transcriptional regulator with XRE-family HTH domain
MARDNKKKDKLSREVKKLYDNGKGLTFVEIGAKLGISDSYANKLYNAAPESDISEELMDVLEQEFNEFESVTVVFFNPEEDSDGINQLTITTEIKPGLKGDKRSIAIGAAIQKDGLLKWVEV